MVFRLARRGFGPLSYRVTRDEHKAILAFIEDAMGGDQSPMDIEADAIIRAIFKRNPDAAYRMTMLAMASSDAQSAQKPLDVPRHKGWLSALLEKRLSLPSRRETGFPELGGGRFRP
jgi:hypothetical protein